jgi:hypothetical protein
MPEFLQRSSSQRWHEYAHLPYPPDHPVSAWRRPGEVIYPGLGVTDWQLYLDSIELPGRKARVREASRTLFLTSERVIVLNETETERQQTSLPLGAIDEVNLISPPPGKPIGGIPETMIQVFFRPQDAEVVWQQQQRAVGWTTLTEDAEVFVKMLRGLSETRSAYQEVGPTEEGSSSEEP